PRPRSSSRTLWSDSVFLTGLSQIMALSSLGRNSQTGAKSSASRSATLPWHTHKATGRRNVPTTWCSRVSSQGYLIGSNRTQATDLATIQSSIYLQRFLQQRSCRSQDPKAYAQTLSNLGGPLHHQ